MKSSMIWWNDIKKELPPVNEVSEILAYYDFGNFKQIKVAYNIRGKIVEEIHDDVITTYKDNEHITMWAHLPDPKNICDDISARSYDEL